ncbi:Ig-like domain-containing protein [Polaribacter sp. Z014]|uniref:Ig-like domain-containing protein n=1 Tax=Polaribacter sp. Z014 TaxID=2927126 RepID=UPI0020207697|nr:Ig-like domain-containing protein [Polaribacter sp. Z014]MCL7763458.1 Ig-like domain-containing protein [Polaribacter sp. Z014]
MSIITFSLTGFSQSVSIDGDSPLRKWDKIVTVLTLPNTITESTTSFRNNRMDVIFTAPDGSELHVPGFFAADGDAANTNAKTGNQYKAYLRPNIIGNWSYQVLFYTGTDVAIKTVEELPAPLHNISGTLGNVIISNASLPDLKVKGRLQYQTTGTSNERRYLKWAETGEYFLKFGPDSPENLLNYDDFDHDVVNKNTCGLCTEHSYNPHASDWNTGDPTWDNGKGKNLIGAVNYLRDQQMNAMSMSLYGGDDKNIFPWVTSTSKYEYDVSKLEQWEIVFDHAEKNGLMLHFKLAEAENWSKLDLSQLKIYYREMVARFGHHLAIEWNISEEFGGKDNTDASVAIPRIDWLASIDPWQSHRVFHTYPGKHELYYNYLLSNNAKITGASIQSSKGSDYDDAYDGKSGYKTWINNSKNNGTPWVVSSDEQNSGSIGMFTTADINNNEVIPQARKKILWKGLIAGGAGVMWYGGSQGDFKTENFERFSTMFGWTKIAVQQFFKGNGIEYWKMENNDALASGNLNRCLAEIGKTYVIYLENGGTTNIDLTGQSGTFDVKWFNPRSGGNLEEGSVTTVTGGGNESIGTPPSSATSDWVALVQLPNNTNITVVGFSIIPESKELHKNTTLALGKIFTPANATNKTVVWTSSDDLIAIVDNEGVVTAIAEGTATITGITESGSFSDTSVITVVYYPVTGFEITTAAASVIIGETINISTAFTPANVSNQTITWSSSDETVATVNEGGEVKTIKEGATTITANTQDGSFSDTVLVTVELKPVADFGCSFEEENGLLVIEAESAINYVAAGFKLETGTVGTTSPTGTGYLRYVGPNHFNSQVEENMIGYKIKINTPGTYRFQWRNVRDPQATSGDAANDAWAFIKGDGVRFFGKKAGTEYTLTKPTKMWVQKSDFVYDTNGETNVNGATVNSMTIWAAFDTAGEYTFEYGGRSKGHSVDRLVLYQASQGAAAKNILTPESVQIGEDCGSGTDCKTITMNALDFPITLIDGFVQAYKDNGNNAMAINAAQHKNIFAAVNKAFSGEDGTYNLTITTLAELDGESTYVLKVGGAEVGTYQNPETTVDYTPTTKTWEDVAVKNGDIIQVEFSSHSNGKIPENGGFAFSRGRWTKVEFSTCDAVVDPPQTQEVVHFKDFPEDFGNASNTYSFNFTYTANETRDINVTIKTPDNLNLPSNAKTVSVSPGVDQNVTIAVTLPTKLEAAEKYKFVVAMRPTGGKYADNLFQEIKFANVIEGSVLSVADQYSSKDISVFPNPIGNNDLIIKLNTINDTVTYQISDIIGRIILSDTSTADKIIIPSKYFKSKNLYILRVKDSKGKQFVKKLFK